ncbi:metalloproteinase inhibitor 1 [Ambystoma mexicanum]|uniref:metalloproteinase inhibitor 1-like n=1 Tax=Ailuropoda melanoleuca TaxID=9646 RepID=UPI001494B682|nr:metalloproteinase inhibitor 1-like [Ailuropoda melanoleuca]
MIGASMCGMVAVALLLVTSGRPLEACSCGPQHPQTAFCYSDVVIRGRIVGEVKLNRNNSTAEEPSWTRYQIKVNKIYKGFDLITDLEFLYTPMHDSLCGYNHPSNNKSEEFLFSGHIVDGKVMISVCGFNSPWSKLTPNQRRGLAHIYKNGCNCVIVPCSAPPCSVSSPKECLWTDALMSRSWVGHQAQYLACVHKGNDECKWESMKSSAATTIFKTSRI